MIRKLVPLALLLIAAGPATPIRPGLWEVTNQIKSSRIGNRLQTFPDTVIKPTKICLTPSDAAKGPGLAFSDPEKCNVLSTTVGGGQYEYEMQCLATDSDDKIVTKASGKFTEDGYEGEAISVQMRGSLRIEMHGVGTARRIGDC